MVGGLDPLFNTGFGRRLTLEEMEVAAGSLEGARRRLAHAGAQEISRVWFHELASHFDDLLTRLGFDPAKQLAEIKAASPE